MGLLARSARMRMSPLFLVTGCHSGMLLQVVDVIVASYRTLL